MKETKMMLSNALECCNDFILMGPIYGFLNLSRARSRMLTGSMRKLDRQLGVSRAFTKFPLDSVVEHIYQPLTSLFFLGFFVWGL